MPDAQGGIGGPGPPGGGNGGTASDAISGGGSVGTNADGATADVAIASGGVSGQGGSGHDAGADDGRDAIAGRGGGQGGGGAVSQPDGGGGGGRIGSLLHPGGWHTAVDIARIRRELAQGAEPWKSAAAALMSGGPTISYIGRPVPTVGTDASDQTGNANLQQDASNAYTLMVKWIASGNIAYADAAMRVLDGWSSTLQSIIGHNARLAAGIQGSKMAQAAELCAYAKGGAWSNRARLQTMFRTVFYPLVVNFAQEQMPNGNWDAAALASIMAIAVFSDDLAMYERALAYWKSGQGNGSVAHYILSPNGQCQESGRDQPHTMGGIGHLVEAAEVAWNQGDDLFGYDNNRLLVGLEYTAKYNLGNPVPFVSSCDVFNKYCFAVISPSGRGNFSPIWEMAYQAYRRKGIVAPFTKQVRDRPGYAPESYNADHPGIGTLTFTQ